MNIFATVQFTKLRVVMICALPPLPMGLSAMLMPDCADTDDKEECLRVAYTVCCGK